MQSVQRTQTLASVLFCSALVAVLALPFPLSAQSSSVQYGRSPRNGAIYLLPTRGSAGDLPRQQSIASGIVVSCAPTSLNANIGEIVTWFSSVTGGSGSYLYAWSGTEGLSGNASSVAKVYTTNGEKFTTLTVTSGSQVITVSCGTVVIGPRIPQSVSFVGFGASCYATPERVDVGEGVTWLAIASGVTASTTYEWDGTDNLSGNRPLITRSYATRGIKAALLTVTNGNARVVAACTNAVTVGPKVPVTHKSAPALATTTPPTNETPDLQGLCAPSVMEAGIGDEIIWQASAIGGTGNYRFTWTGDDALSSEGTTTAKKYETTGTKKASVTITSGSQSRVLVCTPVDITKKTNGLFAGGFFSWFDSPLCLILAAILAIIVGVSIARRRRAKEAEEDEQDYKPTPPSAPAH